MIASVEKRYKNNVGQQFRLSESDREKSLKTFIVTVLILKFSNSVPLVGCTLSNTIAIYRRCTIYRLAAGNVELCDWVSAGLVHFVCQIQI